MKTQLLGSARSASNLAFDVIWAARRVVTRDCPVCGEKSPFERLRGYGRVFLKCHACSHIWARDYSKFRANLGMGTQIGADPAPGQVRGELEMGGASEEFLSRFCIDEFGLKSILLFGTGPTRAFRTLLRDGFDVYGCDVSPSVISYRQREFGCERFFHARVLGRHQYDIVIATEVIEHLFDPIPTFRLMKSILRTQGVFCGSTCFSMNGEVEDDHGFGYMRPRGHINYWSQPSLRTAFSRLQWTMHALRFHSMPANRRFFFGTSNPSLSAALDEISRRDPILPYSEIPQS